jgi:hypothetical protein
MGDGEVSLTSQMEREDAKMNVPPPGALHLSWKAGVDTQAVGVCHTRYQIHPHM